MIRQRACLKAIARPEMRMHRVFHAATWLAVLLHVLLGCCAHHGHADHGLTGEAGAPVCDGRDAHRSGSHLHHGGRCCHHEPPAGDPCGDAACVFVLPVNPSFEDLWPLGAGPRPVGDVIDGAAQPEAALAAMVRARRAHSAEPVRPHLANQVLLL